MTQIAGACNVTEQTVRRWWNARQIPIPSRHGRAIHWTDADARLIIHRYLTTGKPSQSTIEEVMQ